LYSQGKEEGAYDIIIVNDELQKAFQELRNFLVQVRSLRNHLYCCTCSTQACGVQLFYILLNVFKDVCVLYWCMMI